MISKFNHKIMGVLNITPNSFSDGGHFNNVERCQEVIESFVNDSVTIIDVGAESTAPFNKPISCEEEINRFKNFFFPAINLISNNDLSKLTFSIDTYRSKTFIYVYDRLKLINPDFKIIWNDVSGVIDNELFDTLKRCEDADYIFCHTLTEERDKSSNHMDRVIDCHPSESAMQLSNYFRDALKSFREYKVEKRILFDTCFGFSKTYEQNMALMNNLKLLIESFSSDVSWVIGISRKSFLKKSIPFPNNKEKLNLQLEMMQSYLISGWIKELSGFNVIYRVHDPVVYFTAVKCVELF